MYDFLLSDEAKILKQKARKFASEVPHQLLIDMDADKIQFPTQFVKDLADAHLLGLRFDKKYGGQNLSWVSEMAVLEEIGVLSMALSCLYSLPSICGEALNEFGTDKQKEKYLRTIISGEKFCAEALTEPRGGSDFYGATTTAVKDGDQYILNGEKRFVVGAEGADFFLVYAKTDKNAPSYKSISMFIVERDMGVEEKYVYGLMGTRGGGAGRLYFKDVQVPAENIVLSEGDGGRIFNQMMYPERMTSAAGVIGMAKASIKASRALDFDATATRVILGTLAILPRRTTSWNGCVALLRPKEVGPGRAVGGQSMPRCNRRFPAAHNHRRTHRPEIATGPHARNCSQVYL